MNSYPLLRRIAPSTVLVATVMASLILIVGSWAVDTWDYDRPLDLRQVGYRHTLNWAIGFTLVVPLAFFFMLSSLQEIDRLADELAIRKMLVSNDLRPTARAAHTIKRRWTELLAAAGPWATLLTAIGVGVTVLEWWKYSGSPLLDGVTPSEQEIDWSVKFATSGEESDRRLNAAFSAAVFSFQALFLYGLLHFVVMLACFSRLIRKLGLSSSNGRTLLVPDISDDDPRRGYQVFEGFVLSTLLAAALSYGLFYLSRVWNAFLHAPASDGVTSVYDYVLPDVARGFTTGAESGSQIGVLSDVLAVLTESLFDVGDFTFSEYWDTIGALALFTVCVGATIKILRTAALDGRRTLLRRLEALSRRTYRGLSRREVEERLADDKLRTWPLGYPAPNELLILGGTALISLFFFRVGLIFLGLMILATIRRGTEIITRRETG